MDELKELIQLNQVFRVGIVKTRFVTEKFSNPWLLHSFDIKRRHREAVADDIGAVNYCNPTVRFLFFLNWLILPKNHAKIHRTFTLNSECMNTE